MCEDSKEKYSRTQALGEADIFKLIVRYSIPTISATIIQTAYNVVDRIFVGRACGADALAGITVCFSPMMFVIAFGMLIGLGSAAMISIKIGQKDKESAEKILGQCLFLYLCVMLTASISASIFASDIMRIFGASESVLKYAVSYFRIVMGCLIFQELAYGMSAQIRAEGRPAISLITMIIGAVLHIIFAYIFLFHFGWGVEGAAIATGSSQFFSMCFIFYFYLTKKSFLELRFENMKIHTELIKEVLPAGSPHFVVQMISSIVITLVIAQTARYGSDASVAIMGIAMTINMFAFMPVLGINMGIQPIIGYNWGAKNYARVMDTWKIALKFGIFVSTLGFVLIQVFPRIFFDIFLGDGNEVVEQGIHAIRIMTIMLAPIGINIVMSGYFQSTGRPKYALMLPIIRQGIFLAPLIILLPKFFGLDGVWMSFPIADFFAVLYSGIVTIQEWKRLARLY